MIPYLLILQGLVPIHDKINYNGLRPLYFVLLAWRGKLEPILQAEKVETSTIKDQERQSSSLLMVEISKACFSPPMGGGRSLLRSQNELKMKTISVIMPTFNSGPILEKCLKSIRSQDYDQKKIEIVVADGGSNDGTLKIIKKYKGRIIAEKTGSPEAAKSIAIKHAKNEIILKIADDNILPDKKWLAKMISFFDKEPGITAVYPWRYQYQKHDKILNRYFALFGVNDPVPYFLGKADRQSYLCSKWVLAGDAKDKGDYFLVEFNLQNMPTLGDNGFLIKKKLLQKAKIDEKHFFHIDVNWDLIKQGYSRYVVVKNDIIHASGEGFWRYFAKRRKYMENLYLKNLAQRRYLVYNKKRDRKKIILFSFYALTFVGPLAEATRGFSRIPDLAWFLHPIVCFLIFWIYFLTVIKWQFSHYLKRVWGQK